MTKRRRQLEAKRKRRLKRLLMAQEAMAKSVGSDLSPIHIHNVMSEFWNFVFRKGIT